MNQTFFDLIVHGEGVIGLHVGRNQDLPGVLQHLKRERELNLQGYVLQSTCYDCYSYGILHTTFLRCYSQCVICVDTAQNRHAGSHTRRRIEVLTMFCSPRRSTLLVLLESDADTRIAARWEIEAYSKITAPSLVQVNGTCKQREFRFK